ncbi:MAG TPA: HAMP domain-containing sensor histidine kinase [Blastocatellia bacterium]|nr:HAMP domain-containing sensor histidine kinase [Blastocatellia bacterium]
MTLHHHLSRFPNLRWWRYAVAALSSAVALLLTLLIDDPLVEPNTLLLLLLAVMFSSWYGGLGPGLLALLLTTLAGKWFMVPPIHSLAVSNWPDAARLFEFMAVSLLVTCLNTARRKAQARAEAATASAEAATRARDDFIAVASHELRTPLNSILGWISLLRRGQLSPERAAHAVTAIESGARAQSRLIEDLLDASRIINGNLSLNVHPVNLASVVKAAIEVVRPAAENKAVQLHSFIDPSFVTIPGDAERLQQVVWNLLANAIKFTPANGRVEITLKREVETARLSVSDTGRGITPEFLPHVFERFSQENNSGRRSRSGLGLGLSIVHHLVKLHGGTIQAASPGPGLGATFTVRLPLAPANNKAVISRIQADPYDDDASDVAGTRDDQRHVQAGAVARGEGAAPGDRLHLPDRGAAHLRET